MQQTLLFNSLQGTRSLHAQQLPPLQFPQGPLTQVSDLPYQTTATQKAMYKDFIRTTRKSLTYSDLRASLGAESCQEKITADDTLHQLVHEGF
jgi:hypothetical protein